MVIRSSIVSAVAVMCLAVSASAQQATPKIGIISMQGALVGTRDGQKEAQALEAKVAPKRKEFEGRQTEIAQMEDQLKKGGTLMSEEKRTQLEHDIDEKKRRLQRDLQDAQEEGQAEQNQVLQGLLQRLNAVVEKYAKDNGYSVILDASNPNGPLVYASSGIDITQDIIALYDKTTTNGAPVATAPAPGTPKPPATH